MFSNLPKLWEKGKVKVKVKVKQSFEDCTQWFGFYSILKNLSKTLFSLNLLTFERNSWEKNSKNLKHSWKRNNHCATQWAFFLLLFTQLQNKKTCFKAWFQYSSSKSVLSHLPRIKISVFSASRWSSQFFIFCKNHCQFQCSQKNFHSTIENGLPNSSWKFKLVVDIGNIRQNVKGTQMG